MSLGYRVVAAVLYLQPVATCNFTSHVKYVLYFLRQHFTQYVCSAQYGCFLQFLNFVLSRYVAQVLSEVILRWVQSPYYYYYYYYYYYIVDT